MTKQDVKLSHAGKKMVVLGFISIAVLFVIYSRYQNSELFTPDAIDAIQRISYGFYVAMLAAFGAIAYGLYRYHEEKAKDNRTDIISIIAQTTWNPRSRMVFVITFVGYGVFFSLVSGTLIYQPEINFAVQYGAAIPSGFVAPCCGDPGYMPKIIIYLTEHVGLQIIPINMTLQVVVSYLVGLNMSIAVNTYSIAKREGGFSTVGAMAGLFVACPTCAGSFSSIFIGTASSIALTIAITQLQTLFIAISIPVLLITPFIMMRKLQGTDNGCKLDPES